MALLIIVVELVCKGRKGNKWNWKERINNVDILCNTWHYPVEKYGRSHNMKLNHKKLLKPKALWLCVFALSQWSNWSRMCAQGAIRWGLKHHQHKISVTSMSFDKLEIKKKSEEPWDPTKKKKHSSLVKQSGWLRLLMP